MKPAHQDRSSQHHARSRSTALLPLLLLLVASTALAQGTNFTYQGRLQDGGTVANGNYDFQFTLWDASNGGTQQPQPVPVTVTRPNVQVANGVFTTQLDFSGTAFPGANRYLEISVRLAGGAFTILSPRQQITGTPYAIRSASAATADTATNVTQLNGVAASQYVLTGDARLSDARVPTAGSANYIQNTANQQAASNFNISGTGLANMFTANTQFNIQSSRVLSVAGTGNLFVGPDAGFSNPSGISNSFVGNGAGYNNSTGYDNSFFGRDAGRNNTDGYANSFFGYLAGSSNTSGFYNSFFGRDAGRSNTTGRYNSFFGYEAGESNTEGGDNAFFGKEAGYFNTTGSGNSFFGEHSGQSNTTERNNTFIGSGSNGTAGVTNATAIGYGARVTQSNSLVLGSINGVGFGTADTNVGIGTTAPSNRLQVVASLSAVATPTGHVALFENTSTGTSPDVLALKIGRVTNPDDASNFITFFKGDDTSAGAIQGNGAGGVVLGGPGSDYAEWLPRLEASERIEPGDVVGIFNGKISKSTNGASQVMVISTGAIVAGNDPGTNARATHSLVAFIGQAMVRVRGPVQAGDSIVPSGDGDGIGKAVSPERISTEQFAQVIGQAWETSANSGIKPVRVAVGLIRHDPTVKRLLAQSRQQAAQIELLQEKTAQIGLLQEKMAELEARLVASERAMQIIAASSSKRRSIKPALSQNSSYARIHA